MNKILIVDEDVSLCILLEKFFLKNSYLVNCVHNCKKAVQALTVFCPDIVIIDYRMVVLPGKNILKHFLETNSSMPVIIISSATEVKSAVEMMKLGAYDYILKPLYPEEILVTVCKALKQHNTPPIPFSNTHTFLFTESKEFSTVLAEIALVAPTNYSVIIYGESGSGKEGVALEIHCKSNRANAPFIPIDCGTLSKELSASELFGHERGAFTGANDQKIGIFELANGGTVFLDEVANLTYEVQVSLLRVVQQRKIRRVGGKRDIEIDIRILVASNDNLWELSQSGKFREDLYHRFNEFSINLPPLRERKSEITKYSLFFLAQANKELGKNIIGFEPEVMRLFLTYHWPGNLRELKNTIKRAALLELTNIIQVKALPLEIIHQVSSIAKQLIVEEQKQPHLLSFILPEQHSSIDNSVNTIPDSIDKIVALKKASIGIEYQMILEAIKKVNNNKSKAAILLNIDRKTLYNKIKQYKAFSGR